MEPKLYWERKDVIICHCYNIKAHVHCPCSDCEYCAVDASTEYRHWKKFSAIYSAHSINKDENSLVYDGVDDASNTDDVGCCDYDENNDNDHGGNDENYDDDVVVDNDSDDEVDDDPDHDIISEIVLNHVTRTLEFCLKTRMSINHTEEMLCYVGELLSFFDQSIVEFWPTSYYTANNLINEKDQLPVAAKICFSGQHPMHWYTLSPEENCPSCEADPQLMRYYLPLKTKLQLWFSSPKMCTDMLAHWRSKDTWLHSDGPTYPLKELWDGTRFKELKWFWDPNCSWPLPHKCKDCNQYINLFKYNVVAGTPFDLICPDCGTQDQIIASFSKGDPRNIGLIGHFDGWQPGFGKVSNHSSGSIEVSIANMDKRTRNKAGNVFVTSFVPEHMLPKKQPMALDPFLDPLVSELEDLFLNGIEVDYPINVDKHISPGKVKIRCMLLLWTGDYPAQCQVGKFLCKGTFGCRVDKCKGESVKKGGTTKYYFENRFRYRWPWQKRKLNDELGVMEDVETQSNPSAKQRMASATGYTGLSLLCKLNPLYGFNPILDLVHDVMHVVPLNCCKKLISRYLEDEDVDCRDLNRKLEKFPFTSEMKNGHYPKNVLRYKSWTAEDWQKFTFPAAELIFADVVDSGEYELIWLTARMVELLFHFRDGLKSKDLTLLKNICWRRLIMLEETVGAEQCVITCHNTIHIAEDILRFGHCDNFWCFHNERAVQRYKRTLTNFKNIEFTFSKMEMKREIFAVQEKDSPSFRFDKNRLLSSSYKGALCLYNTIDKDFKQQAESNGIFVGVFSGKNANIRQVDDTIAALVNEAQVYCRFRCCVFPGREETVKPNDNVVFSNVDMDFIGQVCELIYVHSGEKLFRMKVFRLQNEVLEGNLNHHKIIRRTEEEIVIRSSAVKRKIIVLKIDEFRYVCVDYNSHLLNVEVSVPVYPSINDMVVIRNGMNSLALINDISVENRRCTITYYTPTNDEDIFKPGMESTCEWDDIISLVQGEEIDGFFVKY